MENIVTQTTRNRVWEYVVEMDWILMRVIYSLEKLLYYILLPGKYDIIHKLVNYYYY